MINFTIFKYNTIISVPLFAIVALLLIRKKPDFSFHKHTVSKTILFINHPIQNLIFRLNFIIKALLDLGFVYFVKRSFKDASTSPLIWIPVFSTFLVASLAYFVEGKYSFEHKIITYTSGILWIIGQIYLAQLTTDSFFIQLTNIISVIVMMIAFGSMFAKKTNVFVQILCILILYGWQILFVFKYL